SRSTTIATPPRTIPKVVVHPPIRPAFQQQTLAATAFTTGFAHNAQHTGLSMVAAQPLANIHWSTPVDLQPRFASGDLLVHYGEPVFTAGNTVIVPVKAGATGSYEVMALGGADGTLKWTIPAGSINYVLPTSNWTPSYNIALTPNGRVYMPGP